MQPYKKQLLRRNAWYRQQLQLQPMHMQQTCQSAQPHPNTPQMPLAETAVPKSAPCQH